MKSLIIYFTVFTTLLLPFSILGQCDSLNVNYNSTWNKYTEIITQAGTNYTLEYTICNLSTENWFLAIVDILILNPSFSPVGPNPIVTAFGNFDMNVIGWDGGLTINSGDCDTFNYDISGSGPLVQEDIRIEVLSFNSDFSTTYCGISLLRVCNSSMVLSGTENNTIFNESSDWINSSQTISETVIVDYDAAQHILLEPEFEVLQGAYFHAFIDGCGGN